MRPCGPELKAGIHCCHWVGIQGFGKEGWRLISFIWKIRLSCPGIKVCSYEGYALIIIVICPNLVSDPDGRTTACLECCFGPGRLMRHKLANHHGKKISEHPSTRDGLLQLPCTWRPLELMTVRRETLHTGNDWRLLRIKGTSCQEFIATWK